MGIIRFSVCQGGVKVRGKVVYKWTRSGNGWETRLLREIAKRLRGESVKTVRRMNSMEEQKRALLSRLVV